MTAVRTLRVSIQKDPTYAPAGKASMTHQSMPAYHLADNAQVFGISIFIIFLSYCR